MRARTATAGALVALAILLLLGALALLGSGSAAQSPAERPAGRASGAASVGTTQAASQGLSGKAEPRRKLFSRCLG